MNPTIKQAKELAKQNNANAVLIISFDSKGFTGASYGKNKQMCKMAGSILDKQIADIELTSGFTARYLCEFAE